MTIPVIKIKVQTKAVVKGKMDVRFPANVIGNNGIIVTRTGSVYNFSFDASGLQLAPPNAGGSLGGVQALNPVTHQFMTGIDTSGRPVTNRPDASDSTYTSSAPNAIATTANAKLDRVYHVSDWGVKGDGTDETEKLQAALDNCPLGATLQGYPDKSIKVSANGLQCLGMTRFVNLRDIWLTVATTLSSTVDILAIKPITGSWTGWRMVSCGTTGGRYGQHAIRFYHSNTTQLITSAIMENLVISQGSSSVGFAIYQDNTGGADAQGGITATVIRNSELCGGVKLIQTGDRNSIHHCQMLGSTTGGVLVDLDFVAGAMNFQFMHNNCGQVSLIFRSGINPFVAYNTFEQTVAGYQPNDCIIDFDGGTSQITGAVVENNVMQMLAVIIGGATVNAGGSGYAVNDVLTVVGGTGTAAQLKVSSVSGGVITAVTVQSAGLYSALPSNPVSVTGGSGTSATFNLSSGGASYCVRINNAAGTRIKGFNKLNAQSSIPIVVTSSATGTMISRNQDVPGNVAWVSGNQYVARHEKQPTNRLVAGVATTIDAKGVAYTSGVDHTVTNTSVPSGAVTWTLPPLSHCFPGEEFIIQDETNSLTSTNKIVVARSGSDAFADGNTSISLIIPNGRLLLKADPVNSVWHYSLASQGITTAQFAANVIDTDGTLAANSDTRLATQKAVATFGASLVLASKVVSFTRDASLASGSQSIIGVGFKPTSIIFAAIGPSGAFGLGLTDSAKNMGSVDLYQSQNTTSGANVIRIFVDNTGSNAQTATLTSYDADGFTLAWTKFGTATGTITLYALCLK